jgi:hypothetical protein
LVVDRTVTARQELVSRGAPSPGQAGPVRFERRIDGQTSFPRARDGTCSARRMEASSSLFPRACDGTAEGARCQRLIAERCASRIGYRRRARHALEERHA